MANVQPENGTLPIAYALAEAFYKDGARSMPDRIMWWVIRNTYGRRPGKQEPRRKMCVFNWSKIAFEMRAERAHVSRFGRALIGSGRLIIDSEGKKIGIQKDFDQWKPVKKGGTNSTGLKVPSLSDTPTVSKPAHPPVSKSAARSNAREILAVQNPNRGVLPGRPPTNTLPDGSEDTVRNRVKFGHPAYDPAELPAWDRMNFDVQRDWRSDWDENCDIRVQKEIIKNYAGENGP